MAYDLLISAPVPTMVFDFGDLVIAPMVPTLEITTYVSSGALRITPSVPTLEILVASGMTLSLPVPFLVIQGKNSWNVLSLNAPRPVLAIISSYTVGILKIRSPSARISITSNNGSYNNVSLTAPRPIIAMTGGVVAKANVNLSAPSPIITISSGLLTSTRKCVVVNTENWEISEYTWTFNQLLKFSDKYFAVDDDGIYLLSGDLFDSELINSTIETGLDDFETIQSKRIKDLWFAWGSKESGTLRVIMDGMKGDSCDYNIRETMGIKDASRVRTGKPNPAKYINFKFANNLGADFTIYGMDMDLILSLKKVRGIR